MEGAMKRKSIAPGRYRGQLCLPTSQSLFNPRSTIGFLGPAFNSVRQPVSCRAIPSYAAFPLPEVPAPGKGAAELHR